MVRVPWPLALLHETATSMQCMLTRLHETVMVGHCLCDMELDQPNLPGTSGCGFFNLHDVSSVARRAGDFWTCAAAGHIMHTQSCYPISDKNNQSL